MQLLAFQSAQLGAAHGVSRSQQLDLVLIVPDCQLGLGFVDLFIGLLQLELLLLQPSKNFGIVEVNDQVFFPSETSERR